MGRLLRFVGDVHSKIDEYYDLIRDIDYSLQLGDVGFAPQYARIQELGIDPARHRFVMGNHDDYDHIPPQALGDFGTYAVPSLDPIFYVRGAWSIDKQYRTIGIDWWEQEQLTWSRLEEAIDLFIQTKPLIMATHECPVSIAPYVLPTDATVVQTLTTTALQTMLDAWKPRWWFFAHYHRNWRQTIQGCEFICLDELSYLDFEVADA